ncbi:MAG TPA: cyclase family protein [Candidatus Dormibacteraeota bacterium]|nr:cyclase family protein [Candidatus Dormibacteraeota bacterium]
MDRRGAVARITPVKVAAAARLVRLGQVIPLSHPLTWPPRGGEADPRLKRPALRRTAVDHNTVIPLPDGRYAVTNDDTVQFALQGSSHWDSLAHFGVLDPAVSGVFYGGRGLDEIDPAGGARTLGIDAVAGGIVTRAIVFDVVGFLGRADPGFLTDETRITDTMLEAYLARHGLTLEEGDAALVYTGFVARWAANGGVIPALIAGLDASSMRIWREAGIAALASDNPTLDAVPMDYGIHVEGLRGEGILLGEYWKLDELVRACRGDETYECLLVSAPLNIPGAFGSPCNALAIR